MSVKFTTLERVERITSSASRRARLHRDEIFNECISTSNALVFAGNVCSYCKDSSALCAASLTLMELRPNCVAMESAAISAVMESREHSSVRSDPLSMLQQPRRCTETLGPSQGF